MMTSDGMTMQIVWGWSGETWVQIMDSRHHVESGNTIQVRSTLAAAKRQESAPSPPPLFTMEFKTRRYRQE